MTYVLFLENGWENNTTLMNLINDKVNGEVQPIDLTDFDTCVDGEVLVKYMSDVTTVEDDVYVYLGSVNYEDCLYWFKRHINALCYINEFSDGEGDD